MDLKQQLFWERFRPNSLTPEKGKIPIILLPRVRKLLEKDLQMNFMISGSGGLGKCVCGDTTIKVRNKDTGEIKEIKIEDLL